MRSADGGAAGLAVETRALTRSFGEVVAVDVLDLRVERGTFYGFLGPNGAGKSTTIKMLTGLLAPSGGEAFVLGRNIFDLAESLDAKRRIGVVPEDLALFEHLTAREHLTFIGRMYQLHADTIRARIDELLNLLGLAGEERKLTLEYSHGRHPRAHRRTPRSGEVRRCGRPPGAGVGRRLS